MGAQLRMLQTPHMADQLASKSWHYPLINDSERAYQTKIIQMALAKNTLVCLPTGMGKTYVALVVMYNFLRWFPSGLCVFMAPSKPLVTQQYRSWMSVFSKLVPNAAVEITSSMAPEKRAELWRDRTVVFTTPQIVENDLEGGYLRKERVSCLVFDEAHRAVGNYAYCGIMRALHGFKFRVCALTATPGSSIPAIQTLISVLQIENVQFYNEDSPELAEYLSLREKQVQYVSVNPEIEQIRTIIDTLIRTFYIGPLQALGHNLNNHVDRISISSLLNASPASAIGGAVEGYLAGLRIFLHIRDLLIFYGILPMINYIKALSTSKGNSLKTRIIKQLLGSEELCFAMRKYEQLAKDPAFYSHPKLKSLQSILQAHFAESESRVMIFSQYRDSVVDICEFLHRFQPQIRPSALLGHSIANSKESARASRAHQQTTIDRFVEGTSNVLVTTSIGEEGLDIGFVDLIILFDAQTSPIRLVQRSGRTGRTRDGRIIILLSEGREMQAYQNSEVAAKSLARTLASSFNNFRFHVSNRLNPAFEFYEQLQCVKFKVIPMEKAETSTKSRAKGKSLPQQAQSIPQEVSPLQPSKSIISQETCASIGHSSLTKEVLALSGLLESDQSRNRKACLRTFQQALARMPIFKPFNYTPVPFEDYKFIFDAFEGKPASENQIDLPDDFFDDDDFLAVDEACSFSDMSFALDLNDSPKQTEDLDMDLEMFDWSDSDII